MRHSGTGLNQTNLDDLTEKISVMYNNSERNSKGDIVNVSEVIRCMVWAKILPLTGKISDSTPKKNNSITYRITIRYRNDIKPDDEIIWRGRRLKILTPPIGTEVRHIWTTFDVEEVIKDGKACT